MTEALFESCGYVATFVGALLEGEISLITSSIGAKLGHYSFPIAMFLAFLGAWIADWFKFVVAKTKGKQILDNKPKIQAKIDKYTEKFDSHPNMILTFYKLFFGTTTIILIIAGIRNVSYVKFAIHTAISVSIWVSLLGGLGYICGEAILILVKEITACGKYVLLGLVLLAFVHWFFYRRKTDKYCLDCPDADK